MKVIIYRRQDHSFAVGYPCSELVAELMALGILEDMVLESVVAKDRPADCMDYRFIEASALPLGVGGNEVQRINRDQYRDTGVAIVPF